MAIENCTSAVGVPRPIEIGSSINTLVGSSRVSRLSQIVEMMESHSDDLGGFLTADPKGSKIPKYLSALAVSLREEHSTLLTEIEEIVP